MNLVVRKQCKSHKKQNKKSECRKNKKECRNKWKNLCLKERKKLLNN